jgi:hypothetical protein
MLWDHIAQLYFSDLDCGLHQLPKLTADHINLKSFSKMKVSFAVQVLSNAVSEALQRHYPSGEADETAKFWKMMNSFFDSANVRSTKNPYESATVFRLHIEAQMISDSNGWTIPS